MPNYWYEAFVQRDSKPAGRKSQGLEKLLCAAFPIQLESGEKLDYEGYTLSEAENDPRDCLKFGRTYAGLLHIRLRSASKGRTRAVEVCHFPLMTGRGTFVVAGVEKVVVGQLQALEEHGPNDLAGRRLYLVGHQLEAALAGPLAADVEVAKRAGFAAAVVLPEFAAAINRFFAHGRFVQQAEKTNPLAFVSQLRRVVQCGFQRPGYEARNIHSSHFGRLCMLETPEGEKIGINLSAAILVQVDPEGRLLTPYRRRDGG